MQLLRHTGYFFGLCCIVFIPVAYSLFAVQEQFASFLFSKLLQGFARFFLKRDIHTGFDSDSISLYLLLGLFIVLSVVLAFIFRWWKNEKLKSRFFAFANVAFTYYLSLQLLSYGFDKIFLSQFTTPEPNILYSPFGYLSPDILYWSTVGTSPAYNIFLGMAEVLSAILLLVKRSRVVGLLISCGILLHIVAVNFSFDISVKLYASFLLFLAMFLLWPHARTLYVFFIQKKPVQLRAEPWLFAKMKLVQLVVIKTFVIAALFFEALYPSIAQKSSASDERIKHLQGAYEVLSGKDSLEKDALPFTRFFIHSDGYLIFQDRQQHMTDFKLVVDTLTQQFTLIDYNQKSTKHRYKYFAADSVLELQFTWRNQPVWLRSKRLHLKDMPALKPQFHWTVEDVK